VADQKDQVAVTFEIKLSRASREIAYIVMELPEANDVSGTTFPVPSAFVSTRILVAVPAVTVIVPDTTLMRLASVAWIFPVPARCPVKVALFESPAGTKSVPVTPPVAVTIAHASAATLAMKLSCESRVMEYTVRPLPDARLWGRTTVPDPSARVSTLT
jgi:hypothetical protein